MNSRTFSQDAYDESDDNPYARPDHGAEASSDVNNWGVAIHLTQFLNIVFPLAGIFVPIILWQVKKNESAAIDMHGRIVTNWIISSFIYSIISVILAFFIIGIPLLIILMIVGIVFPIMAAVKAADGRVWKYPMSISFFDVQTSSRRTTRRVKKVKKKRRLQADEVGAIINRAVEIKEQREHKDQLADEGTLGESDIIEIAKEFGVDAEDVRRALSENN